MTTIKALYDILRKRISDVVFLVAIAILNSFSIIARPYIFKTLIDNGILEKNLNTFVYTSVLLTVLYVYDVLITFPYQRSFIGTQESVYDCFRISVISRILKLKLPVLEKFKGVGELKSRVDDSLCTYDAISLIFKELPSSIMILIGYVVIGMMINPLVTLIMLCITPFTILKSKYFASKIQQTEQQGFVQYQQNEETIFQVLSGYLTIKSYKLLSKVEELLVDSGRFRREGKIEFSMTHVMSSIMGTFINYATSFVVIVLGGVFAINNRISMGEWFAMYLISMNIATPVGQLGSLYEKSRTIRNSLKRIESLFQEETESVIDSGNVRVDRIELQNVDYVYSRSRESGMVLKNVSMSIRMGEKVGLAGRTGSGKSTATKLMLGLYEPVSGVISFGSGMSHQDAASIRNSITYVPQDQFFFNDTILNNITLYNDISIDTIIQLSKKLKVHDFVEVLPDQYDTVMVRNGENFSGGERQRIALLRSLLRETPFYIWDEATSSIDIETENSIYENILWSNEYANKGFLIITHRKDNLGKLDRVYEIVEGVLHQK